MPEVPTKTESLLRRFASDESGAGAVEYAVLVAALAAALYGAIQVFNLPGIFTIVGEKVRNCMTATC